MRFLIMKTILFLFLLPLAACASLDIDGIRLGAASGTQRAKNTAYIEDQRVTEKANGTSSGVRAELVNVLSPDLEVGLVVGFSEDQIQDIGIQNYDIGGAARAYLLDARVRPYFEGRIGYRRAEALVLDAPGGHVDMFTAGASLGLELELGRGTALFGQWGYDGAFGDGFTDEGLIGTIGLSVRF